jgi:hypothetical protein
MRRLTSFFVVPLLLTLPARADDASRRAKAEQLVTMEHLEANINKASENLAARMDEIADHLVGNNPTADQKAKIEDFKKHVSKSIDTNFAWTAMKPKVVDLFASNFTEEQLNAIIGFYQTPAGAALLEKLPQINAQFNQLGTSALTNMSAEMQKTLHDLQQGLGVQSNAPVVVRAVPPANSSKPAPQDGSK